MIINYFIWVLILFFTYIIIWNNIPIYEGATTATATATAPPRLSQPVVAQPSIQAQPIVTVLETKSAAQQAETAMLTAFNIASTAAEQASKTKAPLDIAAATAAQQSYVAAQSAVQAAQSAVQAATTAEQSAKDSISAEQTSIAAQNQYNIDLKASNDADTAAAKAAAA